MDARLLFAAVAGAMLIAATSAMAVETIYPRTYSVEDCQDLNSQIDDSIKSATLDGGMAATIQAQRAGADRACNSGQYGAGTRQLRDVLDEVIAARSSR